MRVRQALAFVGKCISRRVVIAPVLIIVTALCISGSAFSVETYIIRDGDRTATYKSYTEDPATFIKTIDVDMGELDDIAIAENEDHTEITILRAGKVNICVDGEQKVVDVRHDDTVSDALERGQISIGEFDEVSAALHTTVEYGSSITVARVDVEETIKTVDIPFKSETKENAEEYVGHSEVVQEGVNGKKKQIIKKVIRDGVPVSETVMQETTVKEPINKIVEKGTKPKPEPKKETKKSEPAPKATIASGTITLQGKTYQYNKVLDVVATAYTSENISNKYTCTGAIARVGLIAVDPKVIPLGTKMYITSPDGKSWIYGYAVAADTGGAIKGNKIDLFFNTNKECRNFGRRKAKVYILQ